MKSKILIVDDDPSIRFGVSRYLVKAGFIVGEASGITEARATITAQRYDAVVLDHVLPDGRGIDWIEDLRESQPSIAVIIITGGGDIPLAVEAMRRGADNFLIKPVNLGDLEVFLRKCLELSYLRREDSNRRRLDRKSPAYFGQSDGIARVLELATTASENDAPVLLQGETGTGKGLLARWIHEHGSQHTGPFIEINCSSLRGEMFASELFGHARGAFTSAVQDRQGLIEIADGGTLFLDEIGDMDQAVQAQFLKVLEDKCYRRLGEVKVRRSEFRLICASNKDLLEEIRHGRFRQDLYFRISVFPILIPPLRERPGDIAGLVRHILLLFRQSAPEVSSEVMTHLGSYAWPGNIRELRNVLERALLLARTDSLEMKHFPGLSSPENASDARSLDKYQEKLERDHVESVLKQSGDDMEKAAASLGISRATLYRKLKKFRILL